MVVYHVSPKVGPDKCGRTVGTCPFGEDSHFDTMDEAVREYEKREASGENERRARNYVLKQHIDKISEKIVNSPTSDNARTQRALLAKQLQGGDTEKIDMSEVLADVRKPDGGATINVNTGEKPLVGFCYSPYPERSKVFENANDMTAKDFAQYYRDNEDLLSQEGNYTGVWNDPETGKVYLDVSVVSESAHKAREECFKKDQIAFFDLQDFTSVTVDRNAMSGQSA